MPYPSGTETDGEVPIAAQFFDRGGAVFNVMHPDFGAIGDAANDDGAAWNLALAALPSTGGVIFVPPGSYALTTAFSFGSATEASLWIMPGSVLTGESLPSISDDNTIFDFRDGGLSISGTLSVTGAVVYTGITGIDINPGSDTDADLITVGVNGIPRLWWDESQSQFRFNHGLEVALEARFADAVVETGLVMSTVAGIYFDPGEAGSDGDTTIFSLYQMTGTPNLAWDESDDRFEFSHGLELLAGSLLLGSGASIAFNTTDVILTHSSNLLTMTGGAFEHDGAGTYPIRVSYAAQVAHGITSGLPHSFSINATTDEFFGIRPAGTGGGVTLHGIAEDSAVPNVIQLVSVGGTANTTKTTSGSGLVRIAAYEQDGANGVANITADGNVFSVHARVGGSLVTRILVDEDGDLYSVTAAQTFDEYDDLALVDSYDGIRAGYEGWAVEHEQKLIDLGILGAPVSDGGMTNITQLQRLHNGAIRQLGVMMSDLTLRLEAAEQRLLSI